MQQLSLTDFLRLRGLMAAGNIAILACSALFASAGALAEQTQQSPSVKLKTELVEQVNIKAGRAKAQSCTRCHGRFGLHTLAARGKWQDPLSGFIIQELISFREGYRTHAVMNAIAAPLTDEDIIQISMWYESLKRK